MREHLCAIGAVMLVAPLSAIANCGSAFCSINSDFDTQSAWTEPGFRLGLRYEHVEQTDARRGTKKIERGDAAELEHFPLSNTNHNLIASLDYSINERFGLSLTVPLVHLEHERLSQEQENEAEHEEEAEEHTEALHVAAASGSRFRALLEGEEHGAEVERWDYSGLGDVRIVGRMQFPLVGGAAGLRMGLKLPTGATDKRNDAGERAERALQPGTGSTDVIIGAFVNGRAFADSLGWFAEAQYQTSIRHDRDYDPGPEAVLTGGVRYAFNQTASGLLQLNLRFKGRDRGAAADQQNSGGRFMFLSPGLSVSIGHDLQMYAFVQVPLYQRVYGVQLSADPAFVLGASYRF